MADGTCSVDGCDRPRFSKSYCTAHFNRWRRTGSVGSAEVRPWRTVGCSADGCNLPHTGRGYCYKHLYRLRMNGDPMVTRPTGNPCGELNPRWQGDDVEYAAIHARLRRERGRAADHKCVACGSAARDWAYQHTDPDEKISEKVGMAYSTNLDHYRPMCMRCHRALDGEHRWARQE